MKRYATTIEIFVYADDEREAYIKSVKKAIDMNTDDNCAAVVEISEIPYASIDPIKIDIEKFKTIKP